MKRSPAAGLAGIAWCLALASASAAEVVGTAYTVLLRGHGPRQVAPPVLLQRAPGTGLYPAPRVQPGGLPPQAVPQPVTSLRLVDLRSGQTLASAAYDAALDGYMFRLPMKLEAAGAEPCLAIRTAAGLGIAVRAPQPGDNGQAFRHPVWAAEAGRLGELAALRAEQATLAQEFRKTQAEIGSLTSENSGIASPQQCVPGPVQPDPPRPAAALDPAEAGERAGPVCALAWVRAFAPTKVDLMRLFSEAGLSADWSQREAVRPVAQALAGLRLDFRDNDTRTILDAAAKGRAYLEHADGLRAFVRVHGACRAEVLRLAAGEVQAWQAAVAVARSAPERARAACEQRFARIEQLGDRLVKGRAFEVELERRIGVLEAVVPPEAEGVRIDGLACRGG